MAQAIAVRQTGRSEFEQVLSTKQRWFDLGKLQRVENEIPLKEDAKATPAEKLVVWMSWKAPLQTGAVSAKANELKSPQKSVAEAKRRVREDMFLSVNKKAVQQKNEPRNLV